MGQVNEWLFNRRREGVVDTMATDRAHHGHQAGQPDLRGVLGIFKK